MITLISDNLTSCSNIINNNPFGCRIYSLFNTYSSQLPFVDYWVQNVDNTAVSLIARLEATFILCLTDNSDLDEISSFIRVSGAVSVILDGKYKLNIDYNKKSGPILIKDNTFEFHNHIDVTNLNIKEVYSVIKECNSQNFSVPDYESFALDVGHKLQKNSIRILGIKRDCKVLSCIMTLAESTDSAVIGALATLPEFRNYGYGSYLIKYLSNVLINENKKIYIHRAKDENIDFYNQLGFKYYSDWQEYTIKED